jgi:hypothetical protein
MWFILGGVPSPAGASAIDEYQRALDRRRRRVRLGVISGLAAVALAGAGVQAARGTTRTVLLALSGAGLLVAWRYLRSGPDPERWRRGATGEQATAALLEHLPARTWVVLHDRRVPGSRANIDHLVIGPSGVWVLDTKTTRAAVRATWRTVHFGARRLDTGPVAWEAQVVADRLEVAVRPLVVVHGRGLRRRGGRSRGVRVVPADRVVHCLRRRRWVRGRLDGPDIKWLAGQADEVFPPAGQQFLEKGATLRG